MVRVIERAERERVLQERTRVIEQQEQLDRARRELESRKMLVGGLPEKMKRIKELQKITLNMSALKKYNQELDKLAQLPLRETYISQLQSRRESEKQEAYREYQKQVSSSRRALEKGIPTHSLKGRVREIVTRARRGGFTGFSSPSVSTTSTSVKDISKPSLPMCMKSDYSIFNQSRIQSSNIFFKDTSPSVFINQSKKGWW